MHKSRAISLRLEGITKIYPGVIALEDVSLHIEAGEIVGLVGENGAGKSTLMKVLGGVVGPSCGAIIIDGKAYGRLTVAQSQACGIAFVHQELNVLNNLDVAGNVFLGREKTRGFLGWVDDSRMEQAVKPLLDVLGAGFGPRAAVENLSLAEQQLLEIAKALSLDARLVIMDEPTSSLTVSETKKLLAVIARLKARNIAVIFISHRLNEVRECVDRVVVLRDGRVAGHLDRREISHDTMIRMMIGRDLKSLYSAPARAIGAPVLSLSNFRTDAHPRARVAFDIREGEILGLAGLIGAGRTELAEAIFGLGGKRSGDVSVNGVPFDAKNPNDAIRAGVYLVPEDRKRAGLIVDFAIVENITMANLPEFADRGFVSRSRQMAGAERQRDRLAIKIADVARSSRELSGGNQQKVVLAKWLSMKPQVIMFDEPTRGIDVGAKAEIYKLMRALADAGVGVLMISSDMEEVIGVSDRVLVMKEGEISGELTRRDFSQGNILSLAVGGLVGGAA